MWGQEETWVPAFHLLMLLRRPETLRGNCERLIPGRHGCLDGVRLRQVHHLQDGQNHVLSLGLRPPLRAPTDVLQRLAVVRCFLRLNASPVRTFGQVTTGIMLRTVVGKGICEQAKANTTRAAGKTTEKMLTTTSSRSRTKAAPATALRRGAVPACCDMSACRQEGVAGSLQCRLPVSPDAAKGLAVACLSCGGHGPEAGQLAIFVCTAAAPGGWGVCRSKELAADGCSVLAVNF